MFLLRLLLVFLLIPAALVLLAIATPPQARIWILFVAFPLALIGFAALRLLADRRGAFAAEKGGRE
jgi:hypothetical protein